MFCEPSADAGINRFDRTTETTMAHIFTVFFLDCNNKQLFLFRAPCAGNLFPLISNVDCCFLASLLYQKLGGTLHIVSPPPSKLWGTGTPCPPPSDAPAHRKRTLRVLKNNSDKWIAYTLQQNLFLTSFCYSF